jgi:hypothetical protein
MGSCCEVEIAVMDTDVALVVERLAQVKEMELPLTQGTG